MENIEVTVILPMYNEAEHVERCVRWVKSVMEHFSYSYQIIIAEDGSTDNTNVIAARLAMDDNKIFYQHYPLRLGRGAALKRAFKHAKGNIFVCMDADLDLGFTYMRGLIEAAKKSGGMSTGSRLIEGSVAERDFLRKFLSRCYNLMVNLMFRDGVCDHQCGFKAFTKSLIDHVKAEDDDWFWDTEMVVRVRKAGYRVEEIPVHYTDVRGLKESKVKIPQDAVRMIVDLLKLRSRLK